MANNNVNQKFIAKTLNLSVATVSKALSGIAELKYIRLYGKSQLNCPIIEKTAHYYLDFNPLNYYNKSGYSWQVDLLYYNVIRYFS